MTASPECVVVFGASGFIGRNLIQRLTLTEIPLFGVTRSGTPVLGCQQTVTVQRLDELPSLPSNTVVVNVAAYRYNAAQFELGQSEILAQNVSIATSVYHFCAARGLREVRLASSSAVYASQQSPGDDTVPIDLNAWPHPGEAPYSWSKRWAEICAQVYHRQFGINTLAFRLTNPYGPHDTTDASRAHVAPALIIRALEEEGSTLELRGNPDAERDFVYVDDVVEVFTQSLARTGQHDSFNVAFGSTTSIADLAQKILRAAGSAKRLKVQPATGGVPVRRALGAKLRSAFCLPPFTPLDVGLERTVAWYRSVLGD